MSEIKISIIIPCYNYGVYIEEAIKSIEEYKGMDFEIVIINDGSTDDFTNKKLTELKEKGYKVVFQPNQGLARTRNNGIKIAKGEYILPLDADNLITPELLSEAIKILDSNPEISIVYSDRQEFGDSTKLIKVGEFDLSKLLKGNYIDACAVYRKKVWDEIGAYDEKMPLMGFEDWDFWLSAGERNFKFFYIPKGLFKYRVHDNSMIRQLVINPEFPLLKEYIFKKYVSIYYKEYMYLNKYLPIIKILEHRIFRPFRYFYNKIRL